MKRTIGADDMKTVILTNRLTLTAALVTSFVLTSCGPKSTNPVSQYDIKSVPAHGKVDPNQVKATSPFQIEVMGDNDQNFANFTVGQKGSIRFVVRVLDARVTKWTLSPVNVPLNSTLTQSQTDPNQWILEWTPPRDIIEPKKDRKSIFVQVKALVLASADSNVESRLKSIESPSRPFEIAVQLTGEDPQIVGVSKIGELAPKSSMILVSEGDQKHFTIDVKDPGAYPGHPPTLEKKACATEGNKENFELDGSTYVMPDPFNPGVKQLENGNWRFHRVFDTKLHQVRDYSGSLDPKAPGLNVCFSFEAVSPSGNRSGDKLFSLQIQFKPEAPRVLWSDSDRTVELGSMLTHYFSAEVKSKNGTLEITLPDLSSWPNSPSIECLPAKENGLSNPYRQICELRWSVPKEESLLGRSFPLSARAVNYIGAKPESINCQSRNTSCSNVSRNFVIVKPPEPKAVAAPKTETAPKAPSKAKPKTPAGANK
jgi:hypothetical protein